MYELREVSAKRIILIIQISFDLKIETLWTRVAIRLTELKLGFANS